MEVFINELSLSGQYHNQTAFEQAILEFMRIFTVVQSRQLESYKNDGIFLEREAIKNEHFSSSFERISNRQLKDAFRDIVFNKLNPKNWRDHQLHKTDDLFHCKTIDDFVEGSSIAEVAERNIQDAETPRILINFTQSLFAELTALEIFKNDINEERPIELYCADNKIAFERWCPPIIEELDGFLKNSDFFKRTSYHVKGAVLYQNIHNSQYWYLDTLHKTHFEVFNAQQIHLGEATLIGNLIPNTADNNKNSKLPF